MIFCNEYKVGIEAIGSSNLITDRGILSVMEDIASLHSAQVGYGVKDIESKRRGWILLDWQIKVIKRPSYNERLIVRTWSRAIERACAYRDFEFKNEEGDIAVIGTSRWILFDIDTRRPLRLTEDIAALYDSETQLKVFDEEIKEVELNELALENAESITYRVMRRDIDINSHMHNINYLDVALEALPEDVYEKGQFNSLRIKYKREIKYKDEVCCKYFCSNGIHIIVMLVNDRVHAVVELA